jgi:hypothetical protein
MSAFPYEGTKKCRNILFRDVFMITNDYFIRPDVCRDIILGETVSLRYVPGVISGPPCH